MLNIANMAEHARKVAGVQAVARRYADAVRKHFGERVESIRLYGSAARGEWSEDSDIDVLVLLDEVKPEDETWLVKTAYRMGLMENRLLLQPLFLSADDYSRLRTRERRLALDVEREGIVL